MNYYLSSEKKPNMREMPLTFTVTYSEIDGLRPKGCVSLKISLKSNSAHSAADLIKILESLPRSIENLELPWHDNIISITDFIKVLNAIPEWVTSLKFTPDMNCKTLSARDIDIMDAIPKSCKAFWYEAFNIPQADILIFLLESLSPSITEIILFQDKLKRVSQQKLSLISIEVPTTVKKLIIAQHYSDDEGISADDMVRILEHTPLSIVDLSFAYFKRYNTNQDIIPSINDAERVLKAIPPFVTNFNLVLPTIVASSAIIESHKRLLRAVPLTVVDLSVDGFLENNSGKQTIFSILSDRLNQILSAFSILSDRLSQILSAFGIQSDRLTEILSALQTLPTSVSKLHLTKAGQFTAPLLTEMMRTMPASILELILDFTNSDRLITIEELANAIRLLPTSVNKFIILGITDHFWYQEDISTNDLMTIYQALPKSFGQNLTLDYVNRSESELVNILHSTPIFIESLCLSGMTIGSILSAARVSRIFRAIPANVNILSFRKSLFRLGGDGIISALQCIPSGITHLDLRDNYFHPIDGVDDWLDVAKFTAAHLVRILQAIPAHVTHIYINYEDMQAMKEFTIEEGIFDNLNLYYDFTQECFVRMELNRKRLSHISLGTLPSAILTDKVAPYLSFRDLTRVVHASMHEDQVVKNNVNNSVSNSAVTSLKA